MDARGNGTGDQGVSTLLLVDDAEFELHASTGSLAFEQWGSIEARGKIRVSSFSLSLTRHANEANAVSRRSAIPLVITAPLTSRFRLRSDEGSSLMPLLREDTDAPPLRFFVEFIPPEGQESDYAGMNFQDHVVIQTRLARLSVRLYAMRDVKDVYCCGPETFQPQILPSVKAPSFKLFEQIEKDAAVAATCASVPQHRLSVSDSFHPQRNPAQSLAPLPVIARQPTPPHLGLSRPPSSDGRRTASPRVLEPLESTTVTPRVTSDVTSLTEAREVIRRLRARRSSQPGATKPTDSFEVQEATGPESRIDAKAKAELDEFNAIVKAAKQNVAGEMDKAKEELDFYKALLPKQPVVEGLFVLPDPVAPLTEKNNAHPSRVGATLPKKPARLPTLPSSGDDLKPIAVSTANVPSTQSTSSNNNQELSPVKRVQHKPSKTQSKAKHPEAPERAAPEPQSVQRQSMKPATATRKPSMLKPQPQPQATAVAPIVKPTRVTSGSQESQPTATPPVTKTKGQKPKSKQPTKAPTVSSISDDALMDFDDADPEVDDAPWLPDDMHRDLAEDDEDDVMLTMKVPS